MEKVFGYIRVSGKGQVQKDGPDRQREAIRAFCAQNNLELVEIYRDLAVSGTVEHEQREGFSRMILDALDQGVKIIVVETMQRLARDLIVSEFMIRELSSRGMALYSVEAGLQDMVTAKDQDPGRTFIRQVFAAAAQLDKSSLVLKLRAARNRIRELEGKCEGGIPMEETPDGIKTLNLMTMMRKELFSWQTVAIHLNFSGHKKPNGKDWNAQEVASAYRRFAKRFKAKKKREEQKQLQEQHAKLLQPSVESEETEEATEA
jgi:DNA invertase Pin-like site-specific DNA recombinase